MPLNVPGADLAAAMTVADHRLYAARRNGRNRVGAASYTRAGAYGIGVWKVVRPCSAR